MKYASPTIEPLGGTDLMEVQGTWLVGNLHVVAMNFGLVVSAAVLVQNVAAAAYAVAVGVAVWL